MSNATLCESELEIAEFDGLAGLEFEMRGNYGCFTCYCAMSLPPCEGE